MRASPLSSTCLGPDVLRRLLAPGHTPTRVSLHHLDQCEACRLRLQALAGGTSGLSALTMPRATTVPSRGGGFERRSTDSDEVLALLESLPWGEANRCFGRYEILATAGMGGMGIVLRARDLDLQRVVALKVMRPALTAIPVARRLFLAEARAMAAVVHPHVVTIHAVGNHDGHPYLVMQWVAGGSLRRRIAELGRLPPAQVLRIGAQAARGLAAAHARGVVHRDITPANVLLESGSGDVKITDFGLAGMGMIQAADSGGAAGTVGFIAPECERGGAVDHRADLFGLGATLYEACVGAPPPPSGQIRLPHCVDPRRPRRDIHESLAALIDELLAEQPEHRPAAAVVVAERCERLLAHDATAGR